MPVFAGIVAAGQLGLPVGTAALSIVEASDALTAVGRLIIKGALAATEDADTIIATAYPPITGTAAVTEDADTMSALGLQLVPIEGIVAATEAGDTITAAGANLSPIHGTVTILEAADTLTADGLQVVPITGTLSSTEASDTLVATGEQIASITGTLSITEDSDALTGGGNFGPGTVWDSTNKSSNIALGRLDVVAMTNGGAGAWKGVRGTKSFSTGKRYLEFIVGDVASNGWIVGFGNSSFNTASYPGNDSASFGFQNQGGTYNISGGGHTVVLTEILQIAIDLPNKLIWTRTDRQPNWNNSGTADPATGTGGVSYTTTGALFPVWSGFNDGGTNRNFCILNAGGFTFAGTIPSGFQAWDYGVPVGAGASGTRTWDPANKNANIVLSSSDSVATQNSATATWAGVRSICTIASGQYYIEMEITAYDGSNGIIAGIADSAWSLANGSYPGADNHSTGAAVGVGGWYWKAATNSGQPGTQTFALNHIMGFAIDANRGLVWVKDITAGGNWNNHASGDPVAGTRGAIIPILSDIYLAFSGDRVGGNSDAIRLNAGASAFTGTPPTGYIGIP